MKELIILMRNIIGCQPQVVITYVKTGIEVEWNSQRDLNIWKTANVNNGLSRSVLHSVRNITVSSMKATHLALHFQ